MAELLMVTVGPDGPICRQRMMSMMNPTAYVTENAAAAIQIEGTNRGTPRIRTTARLIAPAVRETQNPMTRGLPSRASVHRATGQSTVLKIMTKLR